MNWKWKPRTSVLSNTCPWKWTIVLEECKKPQTVATSGAFFQYSFATQIQKKSFYSKKKRFEYRRKRVNSEANFRAMYTWTSISVQTRGSRERWFGNNSLLGGFWGIRVTWLGFHSNSPHIFGTASAAVERVFSFFGNKFDDQNLANAQIKGGLHLKPPCCSTTINAP